WHLLADPMHRGLQSLVRDLNRLYRELPALHEGDCDPTGFEWIEPGDADNAVLAFLRRDRAGAQALVVCNFTPVPRRSYRLGVRAAGRYRELLTTDAAFYGGSDLGNAGAVAALPVGSHRRPHAVELTLPPLATLIFEWIAT